MDARLLHEAEVTIELLGKGLTAAEIAQAPDSAHKLLASLTLLVEFCMHGGTVDISGVQN